MRMWSTWTGSAGMEVVWMDRLWDYRWWEENTYETQDILPRELFESMKRNVSEEMDKLTGKKH